MLKVIGDREWLLELFNDQFHDWLRFLMDIIDFDHHPQDAVTELMSEDRKIVVNYSAFIEEQVCASCIGVISSTSVGHQYMHYRAAYSEGKGEDDQHEARKVL